MTVQPVIDQWLKADLLRQEQPVDLRLALANLRDWQAGWANNASTRTADAREEFEHTHRFWQTPKTTIFGSEDSVFTSSNHRSMNIRTLRPMTAAIGPPMQILYLHGGGWILGSNNTHDNWCRMLSNGARSTVTMIEYPKAPENGFDSICDATFDAISTYSELARKEGCRLCIAGDSAGATLALLACLRMKEPQQPDGLALLYGPYCPSMTLRSHRDLAQTGSLTDERLAWFWSTFLGESMVFPDLFSHHRLKHLPPTILICGGLDLLLDDTLKLAKGLLDAGRPVSMVIEPGLPHGFFQMVNWVSGARRAAQELYDWIDVLIAEKGMGHPAIDGR